MSSKRFFGIGIGVLVVAGILVIGAMAMNQTYTFRGSVLEPAQTAPEVHLVDQDGKLFQMRDVQGKVVVLFFGYTHCPDECPTTLAQYRQMRSDLGTKADQVQMIFITVDPLRDTPEQIKPYLAQYKSNVIGLSGSKSELAAAWKAYGVFVEEPEGAAPDSSYEVVHTNRIYIIDAQGKLRLTYTYGTPTEDILADVQYLLKGKQG